MWKRTIAGLLIIFIGIGAYYYMNTKATENTNINTYNIIKGRLKANNTFMDYDNTIGVTSISDLGYKVKDKVIYLTYGNLQFKLANKDLVDKDFISDMKKIGIEIKKTKSGDYVLYYWGEKIQKWTN
jgi:hypothetical protein